MDDLLIISFVLIGAKIGGEISKRLNQPALLGEILAGILLGGSLLGVLEINPTLDLLSNMGIILLLFLAGLTIDVQRLRQAGKVIMVDSFFDVAFAFLLGYLIGIMFSMPHVSAMFLGGILTATSVGITTRTLMDIGKLNTKAGTTIIGVAVLDDILGIFILSLLAGIVTTKKLPATSEFLLLLLMITAFFVFALFAGPKIVRKTSHLVEKMVVDEASLSITIAFVLLFAFIAQRIGLAYIIGAFLAGLAVNMGLKYKENISTKINTLTYGLFAPFFFVEVGIRTDLTAVMKTGLLLTIAIIVAAAIGKFIGCSVGSLIMGYTKKDAVRVGVGMLPRAEVALITAKIGLTAGAISEGVFSSIIVMVVVMAIGTPPLLKAVFDERKPGRIIEELTIN